MKRITRRFERLVQRCTFAILDGENIFGTGFFVAAGMALTCAHVWNDLGRPTRLRSRWQPETGERHGATTLIWSISEDFLFEELGLDLLLLKLEAPKGARHPCVRISPEFAPGDSCYLFGYTRERPKGVPGLFLVEGETGEHDIQLSRGLVQPGMSGAPVVNLESRAVCGVVHSTRHDSLDLGGYSLSLEGILEFPFLREKNQNFHDQDHAWDESASLDPSSLSIEEIGDRFWNRYRERSSGKLDLRFGHSAFQISPLHSELTSFISSRSWHQRVRQCIWEIRTALHDEAKSRTFLRDTKELQSELDRIHWQHNYRLVSKYIQEYFQRTTIRELQRDLLASDRRHILRRMQGLQDFVQEPYGRCFFLMGRMGSGKSFLSASLREEEDRHLHLQRRPDEEFARLEIFPLLLDLRDVKDLEEELLDALRLASGEDWKSLSETQKRLSQAARGRAIEPRILIIIDDFDRALNENRKLREGFSRLVEQSTCHSAFYWLLTATESSLSDIDITSAFWPLYGYMKSGESTLAREDRSREFLQIGPSGWHSLDRANQREATGRKIFNNLSDLLSAEGPSLEQLDAEEDERINNPLFACLLWSLCQRRQITASHVVNFNFLPIVHELWQLRYEKLQAEGFTKHQVESLIHRIARSFVNSNGRMVIISEESASETACDAPSGRPQAMLNELEALARMGFIAIGKENDFDIFPKLTISIEDEMFWGHQTASFFAQSKERHLKNIIGQLSVWCHETENKKFRGSTTEFFALIQDSLGAQPVQDFLNLTIPVDRLSQASIWLATAKGSKRMQTEAVQIARECDTFLSAAETSKETLFAQMHFLGDAASSVLSLKMRIKSFEMMFDGIRRHSLEDYFLFLANGLLRRIEKRGDLLSLWILLNRAPARNPGQRSWLARQAVARFAEIHSDDSRGAVNFLQRFIGKISPQKYARPWRRTLFHEWVLHYALSDLFLGYVDDSIKGAEVFRLLQISGWFSQIEQHENRLEKVQRSGRRENAARLRNLTKNLRRDKEREASIAFGYWFRYISARRDLNHRDNILSEHQRLLDELRWGTPEDRRLLFHIIRHTVSEEASGREMVHPNFRDHLQTIADDEKQQGLIDKFRWVFEINKIDLPRSGVPT